MDEKDAKILNIHDYALRLIEKHGYTEDVEYLRELLSNPLYEKMTMEQFFRQYIWVVFTCGFRARTVKRKWNGIEKMVCDFNPQEVNKKNFDQLLDESPIKNEAKLKGILKTSRLISDEWIKDIRNASINEVKEKLKDLPYIGAVTVYHLMRNIGFDVFKPDRHIENLASELEVADEKLFETVIENRDEKYIGVVDYVLWRACEVLESAKTLVIFAESENEVPYIEGKVRTISDFLF